MQLHPRRTLAVFGLLALALVSAPKWAGAYGLCIGCGFGHGVAGVPTANAFVAPNTLTLPSSGIAFTPSTLGLPSAGMASGYTLMPVSFTGSSQASGSAFSLSLVPSQPAQQTYSLSVAPSQPAQTAASAFSVPVTLSIQPSGAAQASSLTASGRAPASASLSVNGGSVNLSSLMASLPASDPLGLPAASGVSAPPSGAAISSGFPLLGARLGADFLARFTTGLVNFVKKESQQFHSSNPDAATNRGKLEDLVRLFLGPVIGDDSNATNQIGDLVRTVLNQTLGGGNSNNANQTRTAGGNDVNIHIYVHIDSPDAPKVDPNANKPDPNANKPDPNANKPDPNANKP